MSLPCTYLDPSLCKTIITAMKMISTMLQPRLQQPDCNIRGSHFMECIFIFRLASIVYNTIYTNYHYNEMNYGEFILVDIDIGDLLTASNN